MCGVNPTELSHLTATNFEDSLASDDLLVHFFNDFLRLPTFTESLLYNKDMGLFEVVNGAAEVVSRRIRSALFHSKTQCLSGNPSVVARTPPVDNQYSVHCLDGKQGIQWVLKERFPFFLQSDCYNEYRLAKLFRQEFNIFIQRRTCSSSQITPSVPPLHMSSGSISKPSSQEEHINTKLCESPRCLSSLSMPKDPSDVTLSFSHSSSSPDSKCEKEQEPLISGTAPSPGSSEFERISEFVGQSYESPEKELEYVAAGVVKQVLNNTLNLMNGQSLANTTHCFSMSGEWTNHSSTDESFESKGYQRSADEDRDRLDSKKEKVQESMKGRGVGEKTNMFGKNWEVGSACTGQEHILDICYYGTCCHVSRLGLDEFKVFLRGTQGEKLFHLWMDIERLKTTQSRERKTRYLVLMRSWYLLSSSPSRLNPDQLSRLGLTTSPCWTEQNLHWVQSLVAESLFCYWAPRFWTSPCVQEDRDDCSYAECCVRPLSHQGPVGLPNLLSDNYLPLFTVCTQLLSNRGRLQDSRRADRMLQALSVDSWAGLYLTHFCEQSGNQLWENAINFWTDLQHYRELFYQDGLDPYRVQREAQLLYATYLLGSARRSIGVDEQIRREVYIRMMPAFEELFDCVEEHALKILLDPWILLVNRDEESFQKVCVQEEVRRLESQEYRELQGLYEESQQQLKKVEQWGSVMRPCSDTTSLSMNPQESEAWLKVSPKYQGYHLSSLLSFRHEIRHFMSFLQKHDASVHLTCWLDLDQYRKTPQKDAAVRQERSAHITKKYLTEKYFFGPDSPATADQQSHLLCLAGGPDHLKLGCLSNPVAIQIQEVVRRHIEGAWLPLYLSTAEFSERQERRRQPQAADRLSQHVHRGRRVRRDAWKTEGLWMSSSTEILLFRRILLNPVTCVQFQHFVSLKDHFLENDLLFWLEVQRYKELCHSHSDEDTIQEKISTIINCFINSSAPPALQIDIPPEQAQHILKKRQELGPYIFREAQLSVFDELLKFWPEFYELSSSIQEERLLPLLQEKRIKHRARVRRQRRKEEEEEEDERRAQAELERVVTSFWEEEEEMDNEEGSGETQQIRKSNSVLTPTQPMSWSYSKYMAALRREEVLLGRQNELEASFSTTTDASDCSVPSAGSKFSRLQPSSRSSKMESKQWNRSARSCNRK
ncbi:regulator of G-protein signaling 22 isoform X2 [Antennarius striatus]|uniref:regulator of G-protein signaling 22 isoform X2 n=1 Tax=Antennarius striatus TaxID=241820 RepID=UPI0035B39408